MRGEPRSERADKEASSAVSPCARPRDTSCTFPLDAIGQRRSILRPPARTANAPGGRDGIVVDYIINKAGEGYVLVVDDRDLTPELITLEFESGDAMVAYFEDGKRKPMVLDSVEN